MNVLAEHGLHDIDDESWNAYGQFTYISSWKLPVPRRVHQRERQHQLAPARLRSEASPASVTLFVGVRLWPGGEAYFVPEVIAERPLSDCTGSAARSRTSSCRRPARETPQLYRSRMFLRQTIGLGGSRVVKTLGPDAARDGRRRPAARAHGRQLHGPRRLRSELDHLGSAPDVLQHGVHDPLVVRLPVRRARLLLGRDRRALLGRLGAAHRRASRRRRTRTRCRSISGSTSTTATSSSSSTITRSSDRAGAVRVLGVPEPRRHRPLRRRDRRLQGRPVRRTPRPARASTTAPATSTRPISAGCEGRT